MNDFTKEEPITITISPTHILDLLHGKKLSYNFMRMNEEILKIEIMNDFDSILLPREVIRLLCAAGTDCETQELREEIIDFIRENC